MSTDQIKKLMLVILKKYKSLENPNYSFVIEAIQKKPYIELIKELSIEYQISENTDPNYDVSFSYILTKNDHEWYLSISMLINYAILSKVQSEEIHYLTLNNSNLSTEDTYLIKLLHNHNVKLLTRRILLQKIRIDLNSDQKTATLYQVLFSDSDIVPN